MAQFPIKSQDELDKLASELREDGYPYVGSAENHWLKLLPNGDIESVWYTDGVPDEEPEDRVRRTQEEFAESIFSWRHDC